MILDILIFKTNAEGDSVLWTKTYGGNEWEQAYKAIRTDDGGFALAGETTSWGAGLNDFFLLKLDENCDSLWLRTYGGEGVDTCHDLIQTSDGDYVLVGETEDLVAQVRPCWVLFVDENGDSLLSYVDGYQGGSCTARTIQEVEDGNFIVSGNLNSPRQYQGHSKIWTLGLDAMARYRWERIDVTDVDQSGVLAFASCKLSDSSIAVTGKYNLSQEFGDPEGKLWILEVSVNGDGEYIIDEGWNIRTFGYSILLTTNNELSVAGYAGRQSEGTRYDGQIYLTSELPNRVISGFAGSVGNHMLISAYPNPFNGESTVNYTLPPGVHQAELSIFNLLGKQVEAITIRNNGLNRINWNPHDLSSGVYVVRINSKVASQQIILTMLK